METSARFLFSLVHHRLLVVQREHGHGWFVPSCLSHLNGIDLLVARLEVAQDDEIVVRPRQVRFAQVFLRRFDGAVRIVG